MARLATETNFLYIRVNHVWLCGLEEEASFLLDAPVVMVPLLAPVI